MKLQVKVKCLCYDFWGKKVDTFPFESVGKQGLDVQVCNMGSFSAFSHIALVEICTRFESTNSCHLYVLLLTPLFLLTLSTDVEHDEHYQANTCFNIAVIDQKIPALRSVANLGGPNQLVARYIPI